MLSGGAGIYMAAVLEYLTAEMLELGGNAARDRQSKYVGLADILQAIYNDEELRGMIRRIDKDGELQGQHLMAALVPPGAPSAEELSTAASAAESLASTFTSVDFKPTVAPIDGHPGRGNPGADGMPSFAAIGNDFGWFPDMLHGLLEQEGEGQGGQAATGGEGSGDGSSATSTTTTITNSGRIALRHYERALKLVGEYAVAINKHQEHAGALVASVLDRERNATPNGVLPGHRAEIEYETGLVLEWDGSSTVDARGRRRYAGDGEKLSNNLHPGRMRRRIVLPAPLLTYYRLAVSACEVEIDTRVTRAIMVATTRRKEEEEDEEDAPPTPRGIIPASQLSFQPSALYSPPYRFVTSPNEPSINCNICGNGYYRGWVGGEGSGTSGGWKNPTSHYPAQVQTLLGSLLEHAH